MTLQLAQVQNIELVSSIEISRGWIEQRQRTDLFRGDWRLSVPTLMLLFVSVRQFDYSTLLLDH